MDQQITSLVGDQEILAILDRFGAMPSGESFPTISGAFEAWRRAGVIIKLCAADEFYTHTAYSTACGWSFNDASSRLHVEASPITTSLKVRRFTA